MQTADDWLKQLVNDDAWRDLSLARRKPLVELAEYVECTAGSSLFAQFHPASRFYLLLDGIATQSTTRTNAVRFDPIDWTFAALGWSGFLRPNRYGASVQAQTDLKLLSFSQDELSAVFYADPELAVRFFDMVLRSVRRQLISLRARRVDMIGAAVEPPTAVVSPGRRPVVGRADNCLRRTAFFAAFDDELVTSLAQGAELLSYQPGVRIVQQDEAVDGLLVLASGACTASFESTDPASAALLPFRRFRGRNGIVAGLPETANRFFAEATVYADTHCWLYRVPAALLEETIKSDPEFGRGFQQRLLARMAGLIAAIRMERDYAGADPEVAAVSNMVANGRARLPITSQLHKVPHLLGHRLTVGNAFAAIRSVAETGGYYERLLAARCDELLAGLAAEQRFYQGILEACQHVVAKESDARVDKVRDECDQLVDEAFSHLDVVLSGEQHWPKSGGNIVILNHLSCPEYYQLPNDYHFSFDTAFVSTLVWQQYRKSAIRVVRQSPDAEFGHNLFYSRLGHITVPTLESDLGEIDAAAFLAMRREAGRRFNEEGRRVLATGANLIICPEGQSQPAERSPAHFHSGAFRLAADTGARIVPIALAGFDRRFKDGPLVASVQPAVDVAAQLKIGEFGDIRAFIDAFHATFTQAVRDAQVRAGQRPSN